MEMMEDTLLTKSKVEIPMGEFWLGRMHPMSEYYVDVRMAAAAGTCTGNNLLPPSRSPAAGTIRGNLQNLADYWFAQGVNRIVFHTSAHQPLDTKPGNTMVGTHFNRNITWAEQAKPFVSTCRALRTCSPKACSWRTLPICSMKACHRADRFGVPVSSRLPRQDTITTPSTPMCC